MSAYYKCEIEKDGYIEDTETTEPANLPYYAYVVLVFLLIVFFIFLIMFLIKYRGTDILYFVNKDSGNLKFINFAIFGGSALALIILALIKITNNDGKYASSPVYSVFMLLFIFTLIFSILKMAITK